ncbi:MAG TPA: hypothetical protein VG944_00025, partial [Fimbriimonas sp.]|nr:hypothetical protein [Fimbriimonas sp.]
LLAFIQSPAGHAALLRRGRSSTASLSLTAREVGAVLVPLPPLDVQRRIADLIRAAEENHEAAVRAAEQRRAVALAVAHQLFAGTGTHGDTTANEG